MSILFDGTDFKLTANASTSELYGDTGRMILFAEDFEGTDGTDLDVYDAAWTVTHDVGTETIEIDDAQKHTGSTSLGIYRDGVNNPNALRTIDIQDIGTVDFWFRKDAINTRVDIVLGEGGNAQGYFKFNADGNINILYGDGVGGNDIILVAYSANIWYHIKLDFDIANSKWRVWINNVLYPGSNADAGGWDNLFVDRTPASINRLTISSDIGTHWSWIDDLNIYAGFEDFSALTAPHDIDDITEAVSPSGTDYGRGTWDGDWATNGISIAVDNTKAVIGTNSIKANERSDEMSDGLILLALVLPLFTFTTLIVCLWDSMSGPSYNDRRNYRSDHAKQSRYEVFQRYKTLTREAEARESAGRKCKSFSSNLI